MFGIYSSTNQCNTFLTNGHDLTFLLCQIQSDFIVDKEMLKRVLSNMDYPPCIPETPSTQHSTI